MIGIVFGILGCLYQLLSELKQNQYNYLQDQPKYNFTGSSWNIHKFVDNVQTRQNYNRVWVGVGYAARDPSNLNKTTAAFRT